MEDPTQYTVGPRDLLALVQANSPLLKLGDEHGVIVVPHGWEARDAKAYLPPPARIRQTYEAQTTQSFCDYVDRYAETPAIFADEAQGRWVAVLDYHEGPGKRGHSEHVARFAPSPSIAFGAWYKAHGQQLSHTDFVRFLEDRARDIVSHPAAEIFEALRSLNVRNDAQFSSEVSLTNGAVRFAVEETIRGQSRMGQAEMPQAWTVAVEPYEGLPHQRFDCRLRYRVKDQALTLWYEIVDRDNVVLEARRAVSSKIHEELEDIPMYSGVRA